MKFEFRDIYSKFSKGFSVGAWRARVKGGWIVQVTVSAPDHGLSTSSVFVPDADHVWEMGEE